MGYFLIPACISIGASLVSADSNTWKGHLQQEKHNLSKATVEQVTLHPLLKNGSPERITRSGVLITFEDAEATILFCHGFLCNKYDIGCFRNMFPWGRFNFLTFDFRAHGEGAEGQVSTLGYDEVNDVLAAGEFIRNHEQLKNKPLLAWAFSMGAVATIGAQAQAQLFDGIISDCAYDSSDNLVKQALDKRKISFLGYEFCLPGRAILEKYAFHPYVQSFVQSMLCLAIKWSTRHIQLQASSICPVELIKNITVPCFFIHCKNDDKVPVEAARNIYQAARGPKQLWITKGRGHFDSYFYNPELYAYRVRKWVEMVIHKDPKLQSYEKIIEDGEEKFIKKGVLS
jgi:pimeloyl-ACP methyl ester carboxylesterase